MVGTEMDALLLENSLIKEHQPRYNVMLKDDKTYPWICLKNEPYPRIFTTRKIIRDGSEYYGPYTSMKTVRTLLNLIKSLYPLRSCNYDLKENKIKASSKDSEAVIKNEIFEAQVESKLIEPTFIINYPIEISPLARASSTNKEIAERFELFIDGKEIANGFSELNDPDEQAERFKSQVEKKDSGDNLSLIHI